MIRSRFLAVHLRRLRLSRYLLVLSVTDEYSERGWAQSHSCCLTSKHGNCYLTRMYSSPSNVSDMLIVYEHYVAVITGPDRPCSVSFASTFNHCPSLSCITRSETAN